MAIFDPVTGIYHGGNDGATGSQYYVPDSEAAKRGGIIWTTPPRRAIPDPEPPKEEENPFHTPSLGVVPIETFETRRNRPIADSLAAYNSYTSRNTPNYWNTPHPYEAIPLRKDSRSTRANPASTKVALLALVVCSVAMIAMNPPPLVQRAESSIKAEYASMFGHPQLNSTSQKRTSAK